MPEKKLTFRTIYTFIFVIIVLLMVTMEIKAASFLPGEEEYLIAVEKPPTLIGGMEGVAKRVVYPDMAMKTRTEGKVYLLIYINENGDVDNVKVVKGIGAGCDEEAERVVKKTKFTPGIEKGVPVKTKLALALSFKL